MGEKTGAGKSAGRVTYKDDDTGHGAERQAEDFQSGEREHPAG